MNIPTSRLPQTRFSSGVVSDSKLLSLAACHPFSQQLDLVIPSEGSSSLIEGLRKLETRYFRAKTTLSGLLGAFSANPRRAVVVTAPSHNEEDLWSVDPRGVLTLAVSKETYERLGLVGEALSFKGHRDVHVISIPLDPSLQSVKNRERVKAALEEWDRRRGVGWNVLVESPDGVEELSSVFEDVESVSVECQYRVMEAIHVPVLNISAYPKPKGKEAEELEDWNMRSAALFEWVGMASLGAQRLQANDSVDPFVAVYEPPEPSKVANVAHLQWTGFFSTTFVQRILDVVLSSLGSSFAAISHQAFTNTAVGFFPANTTKIQLQLPRLSGEDTWSLLLDSTIAPAYFLLAESWDGLDNRS